MIKQMRLKYPIPLMSRMLEVSISGYYAWQERPLSQHDREELRLELESKAADRRTKQTYGAERLQYDLGAWHKGGRLPNQTDSQKAGYPL
jgi:hypothetical protein